MANIALVSNDKTHASYVSTKALLESSGHTVTGFTGGEVTSLSLDYADVIVCVRLSSADGAYAAASAQIKAYNRQKNKPVVVGMDSASGGGTYSGLLNILGIAVNTFVDNSMGQSVTSETEHPIWLESGIPPATATPIHVAATYGTSLPIGELFKGEAIGIVSASVPNKSLVVVEAGTTMLDGTVAGGRLAYAGFLYGGTSYTATAAIVVNAILEWVAGAPATISGTVKDAMGAPLSRVVRAYIRSTGRLSGQGVSSAVDGSFSVRVIGGTDLQYVVAVDELSGGKNAVIQDRVLPILG